MGDQNTMKFRAARLVQSKITILEGELHTLRFILCAIQDSGYDDRWDIATLQRECQADHDEEREHGWADD